jgi:hypothetical protein
MLAGLLLEIEMLLFAILMRYGYSGEAPRKYPFWVPSE